MRYRYSSRIPLCTLALITLALACASPGLAQSIGSPVGGGGTVLAPVDEPRPAALDPKKCEDDCPAVPIACGDTMMGTISSVDVADDQGRHFDIYSFSGTSGDQITATLFSNAFEPHLELRTPGARTPPRPRERTPDPPPGSTTPSPPLRPAGG
jgi:hypothetical protein